MEPRRAMYDFVTGLINLVWLLWPYAQPFVLMGVVLKLVRWGHSSARGERDIEELHQRGIDNLHGARNRISYGRSYHQLRDQRFSNRELRHMRGQRSGSRFRF